MEEIIASEFMLDGTNEFQLKYYLISENNFYGIKTEKIYNGKIVDKDSIDKIFETKNEAIKLIKILADNTVTPFTVAEIIDELLS